MFGSFGRDDEVMLQAAPQSSAPPFPQSLGAHHTIVGLSLGKITKGALFPQLADPVTLPVFNSGKGNI